MYEIDFDFINELPEPVTSEEAVIAELTTEVFSENMYSQFTIPKATGGVRTISAPNPKLKQLQHSLLSLILKYGPKGSRYAHAYYQKRGIKTMALPHVDRRTVIKIDLLDFFPRITKGMVRKAIQKQPKMHRLLPLINKWCFLNGGLPMGAPTSPVLSNIVASALLDVRLVGYLAQWRRLVSALGKLRIDPIAYTRYADDIVISSNYDRLPQVIPSIRELIKICGFSVNRKKLKVMHKLSRQVVCGVSISRGMGTLKEYRRKFRHRLHHIAVNIENKRCLPNEEIKGTTDDGKPVIQTLDPANLIGKYEHIRHINERQAQPLLPLLNRVLVLCGQPALQESLSAIS